MLIRTERLEIRPLRVGEGGAIADYFLRNRAFLQPWYPLFAEEDMLAETWEECIPTIRQEYEARKALRLCLWREKRVIGVVNITHVLASPRWSGTLGYSLCEECQGQGLMIEALRSIVPEALRVFGIRRLEAFYMPRNERSARILASLGFEREGLAREYLKINGVWEDHVMVSRVERED